MKQKSEVSNKKVLFGSGAALVSLFAAGSANAAYTMPASISTAFADMADAWGQIEAQIWPILTVVVIGFFVIRMFKKGANKVG